MFAAVAAFKDGTLRWRIVHDAQRGNDHLSIEGQPTESLVRIKTEQFARVGEDRDVDFIFDIPVRVAQELVGFRYDQVKDTVFEILRATSDKGLKPQMEVLVGVSSVVVVARVESCCGIED